MSDWLLEPLSYEFNRRALLAGVLVGFVAGYMSGYVVLRRSALMVEALSHSLLPGIATSVLLVGLSTLGALVGGLVAALLVGTGALFLSSRSSLSQETALGTLFICAFALGVVLLHYAPVQVELGHYLFGNIIGMTDGDLWMLFFIGLGVLSLLVALQRPLAILLFDPKVAPALGVNAQLLQPLLIVLIVLVLVSSLQAVGVLLAVGFMVLPGATMALVSRSLRMLNWGGAILGSVGTGFALFLSYWIDSPPGATMILFHGGVFATVFLLTTVLRQFSRTI